MEEKAIVIEPNYAKLIRLFGKDAVTYMERIAIVGDEVTYEDVYGLVAATRIAISSLNTQDGGEALRAFIEFRENFDKAASKMFEKLNQLREQKEGTTE